MTLSLEQFERDTQPAVDGYLAGTIGEKELQEDGRGWDNYEQSYRPLVEYAKHNQLPVIASNAPKNIVICVGKEGPEILDRIPQPDRSWVAADLHVDEGAYLDKYMDFIAQSSSHGPSKEDIGTDEADEEVVVPEIPEAMRPMVMRSFSAQVTRDDTMAESIAQHLQKNPGRKVLHLNGHFHSASHLGTVERLKIRMPDLKIAVINPIDVEDNNAPAWTEDGTWHCSWWEWHWPRRCVDPTECRPLVRTYVRTRGDSHASGHRCPAAGGVRAGGPWGRVVPGMVGRQSSRLGGSVVVVDAAAR